MNSILKIALYLRISKEDGNREESNSIINQKKLIADYLNSNKELNIYESVVYCDDGYSGTNFERPDFQKMIEECIKGNIGCIVVKDFSRLGRNHIGVGEYLESILPVLRVRLISINDHYDSAENGEISRGIEVGFQTLIHGLYSSDISKKVISSLRMKSKYGKFIGTYAPYGYQKSNRKGYIEIDEKAACVVNEIFELTIKGYSRTKIAASLNSNGTLTPIEYMRDKGYKLGHLGSQIKYYWNTGTILRILKNDVYIGTVTNEKQRAVEIGSKHKINLPEKDWNKVELVHNAIITKQQFEMAQHTIRNTSGKKRVVEKSVFTGNIKCGHCGYTLAYRSCSTKSSYFKCLNNNYHYSKGHLEEELLFALVTEILKILFQVSNDFVKTLELKKNRTLKEKESLILQLNKLVKEKQKLLNSKMELYENFIINDINENEYLKIKLDSENKLIEIESQIVLCNSQIINKSKFVKPETRKSDFTKITKKIVELFLNKVYVYDDSLIEIIFNFDDCYQKTIMPTDGDII